MGRPTRCEGWSVADVVLHLAQTDEMAVATLEGRFAEVGAAMVGGDAAGIASVDDLVAQLVVRERGAAGVEVGQRWVAAAGALREAFGRQDPSARVRWVAGELAVRTHAATRLAECWIHSGDVAEAVGAKLVPGERLRHIARLAWRTLPYAFQREGRVLAGPVAFELRAPSGDSWSFRTDETALTVIEGDALELCLVAGRRKAGKESSLRGTGLDADGVLALVRTYA